MLGLLDRGSATVRLAFFVVGEDFVDDGLVDAFVVDERVLDLGEQLETLALLLIVVDGINTCGGDLRIGVRGINVVLLTVFLRL